MSKRTAKHISPILGQNYKVSLKKVTPTRHTRRQKLIKLPYSFDYNLIIFKTIS